VPLKAPPPPRTPCSHRQLPLRDRQHAAAVACLSSQSELHAVLLRPPPQLSRASSDSGCPLPLDAAAAAPGARGATGGARPARPPGAHAGETKRVCAICIESYDDGDKVRTCT
jgi:hypothetical protein